MTEMMAAAPMGSDMFPLTTFLQGAFSYGILSLFSQKLVTLSMVFDHYMAVGHGLLL